MKTVAFYFKTGLEQLWKEKRCSAILILTTTVTFAAILVLFRIFFANMGTWEELQISRRTYDVSFHGFQTAEEAVASKHVWQWLTEGETLPKDLKFHNLQGCTAGYMLSSYWENGKEVIRADQWTFYAADAKTETAEDFSIREGRFFLPEELEEGKPVVLLSKDMCDVESLSYGVGDTLVLNETSYEIVGFVSGMVHYMPLQTILQTEDIGILFDSVCFSQILNARQVTALEEQLASLCETVENRYDKKMEGLGWQVLSYLIASLSLLGICAITLVRILRYLWFSRRHEYGIYLQCGATKAQTRWIVCLQIVSFCLISAILAVGVYQLFIPVLDYYGIGME